MPPEIYHRESDERKKGIKFDATINLGHIITFIGFMLTIFTAWQSLDKRVVVLEQSTRIQEMRDRNQDIEQGSQNTHINENLTDIKRSIERITERLERK